MVSTHRSRSNLPHGCVAETPTHHLVGLWDLSPLSLLNRMRGYIERSLIFSACILPAFWITMRAINAQALPIKKRLNQCGLWLFGFAVCISPMLPVPATSSLYVYFPSVFVVGSLLTVCRSSSHWPRKNHIPLRRLGVILLLIFSFSIPISWHRGMKSYQQHRHTLDWAQTISQHLDSHPSDTIAVYYNPADFVGKINETDFTFLQMALHLQGNVVRVVPNPAQADLDWPAFDLKRDQGSESAGKLQPRLQNNKAGEPFSGNVSPTTADQDGRIRAVVPIAEPVFPNFKSASGLPLPPSVLP
jgi:hypothetical protein